MDSYTLEKSDTHSAVRNSYWGQQLTGAKYDEGYNIAGILHREIQRSASFFKPLRRYANTYAEKDKISVEREEIILRDIYTERYGQSMSQTREALLESEKKLQEADGDQALSYARVIPTLIQQGETMPYYKAQDQAARSFAHQHAISEVGAKKMMAEAFEKAEGRSLYDYGKELEAKHHTPVREAKREARKAEQRERRRSGPSR